MATFPVSQPVGTQTYGPVILADDIVSLAVSFTNWPQTGRFLAVDTEISMDGGATWDFAGGMNPTPGGRSVLRGSSDCGFVIGPMPVGTGRMARATVTVTGGTVVTTMTIIT